MDKKKIHTLDAKTNLFWKHYQNSWKNKDTEKKKYIPWTLKPFFIGKKQKAKLPKFIEK